MPQPLLIPIKPEWLGDEALGKAKKFTNELEKQKKATSSYRDVGDFFGRLGNEFGKQQKKVQDWSKSFGEVFAQIGGEKKKVWDSFFQRNENGMDRLIKKSRELRQDLGTAFEISTTRGVGFALNKVTSGIEGALGKVFNLKNALLATAVGGVTYGLASRALRGGLGNVRDDARVRREFGGTLGAGVKGSVEDIAASAGVEGGEALAALTPIARAIKETRIGSVLKSGRKLTTQGQVDQVQKQTLGLATDYTKRLLTVFPEASPDEIGRLLAEAGTGEEGIGSLARFVGLGKASTRDLLTDAKKKKLAIGDIVGNVLNRAGVTDQAASDQRKTFDFQIKSIGSQLSDALGNVGTSAIEKLNKSLGEGTTLAERLQKYLASPEGKRNIDALGESLSKVVSFAADLAKKIPEAIRWISDNKTTLLAVAGVYGAVKVGGAAASIIGGAKEFIKGVRGSTPATPLYVTQVGGVGGSSGSSWVSTAGKWALGALAGVPGAAAIPAALLAPVAYTLHRQQEAVKKTVEDYNTNNAVDPEAAKVFGTEYARSHKIQLRHGGMTTNPAEFSQDLPPINIVVNNHLDGKQIAAHTTTEVRRQQTSQARNEAGQ